MTHLFSPSLTNEFIFGPGKQQTNITDPNGGLQKAKYGIDFPLLFNNVQGATTLPSMSFGGISNQTGPSITVLVGRVAAINGSLVTYVAIERRRSWRARRPGCWLPAIRLCDRACR